MKSIKVCEYSRSRSFHYDLILHDQASGERSQDQWSSGWGFRPGRTQTGLYSHRRWLEAGNFGFRKKKICTIQVVKTKALISCAVTAQLISTSGFTYAKIWFSHDAAHFMLCF